MEQKYTVSKVVENVEIANGIYKITVAGTPGAKPGQFFLLRAWGMEPLLSRPISVYDVDGDKISFLYEVRGEGTKLFKKLKKDDEMQLTGPLGNGFDVERIRGKVAVIAGGIGIAPMKYVIKSMKDSSVDLYAGFRDDVYLVDEFEEYVEDIKVTTNSGKHGHKGFVTDLFNPMEYNAVLCCGPEVMMKRVVEICKDCATPVYVSMEKHMACGVGACLVCTCKTKNGNKRTCKDGPVFSGEDVIFDA